MGVESTGHIFDIDVGSGEFFSESFLKRGGRYPGGGCDSGGLGVGGGCAGGAAHGGVEAGDLAQWLWACYCKEPQRAREDALHMDGISCSGYGYWL